MKNINLQGMENINGGEMDCETFAGVYWGMGFVLMLNPVTAAAGVGLMVLGAGANAVLC